MNYFDYLLLHKGFKKKRLYDARMLRRAVVKTLQPYMQKGKVYSEYQIWPLEEDDVLKQEEKEYREGVSEKALARLRAFKEKEKNQKSKDN